LAGIGERGEIAVRTPYLARGYLGDPELTRERFVPDPLAEAGARIYKTGDLGRYLPDGNLEFLGRADHQVKIRGFRVELEEVEAALSRHPGLRECAVALPESAIRKGWQGQTTQPVGRTTDGSVEVPQASGVPEFALVCPGPEQGQGVSPAKADGISSHDPGADELSQALPLPPLGMAGRLVAYVVAGEGETRPGNRELRDFLRTRLPDYMVPSAFVFLDTLPRTRTGKIDRAALGRAALPVPDGRPAPEEDLVLPRGGEEELLAGLWCELLETDRIGVHDDFFELGGHSLLATRMLSRVRDLFGVELPLRLVFESPTVAGLARAVVTARLAGLGLAVPPLAAVSREGELPLSFAQQRLWFLDQLEPGSPAYNLYGAYRLEGRVDATALAAGFHEIVRRHENLRTRFAAVDGKPRQIIDPPAPLPLPRVDLRALAEDRRAEELRRLAAGEARHPFDLARGPLLRTTLVELGEGEHALLLTMHHIIADGWSIGILVHELTALYEAFSTGRPSPLPELAVQYADFAAWQRGWLRGEALAAQLGYWKQQLAGIPGALELPTDRPRPVIPSMRGAMRGVRIPAELTAALEALSRRQGSTLFMTLLAAFKVLLRRYSAQDDVAVGSVVANRNRSEIESLIGFFVNTLVLRTDLSGYATYRQVLATVREAALGAYAHQDVPFEKLVEELDPERDTSRQPFFQVMFILQNAPRSSLELSGLTLHPFLVQGGTAKFDLTLALWEWQGRGLGGWLEYATDLFDATTVDRFAGHYRNLLAGVVADPGQPLAECSLLNAAERHQLLLAWNDTRAPAPGAASIHELFAVQVGRTPEAVAVVFGDEHLSYEELNLRANRLAHHLLARGVGRVAASEVMVGISMQRSLRTVVTILGILKAGGVYLPLDRSYPQERLAFMLADAKVPVLVSDEEQAPVPGVEVVCLDRDAAAIARASDRNPESGSAVGGDHLAYVIYTSGSTGTPKGVAITHRAVVRLVFGTNYVTLGPEDRVAQASTTSFDAATFELWGALLTGARLVGIDRQEVLSPPRFAAVLRERGITALFLTTALFNQMVREQPEGFRTLRHLLFGGEAVDPQRVREALEHAAPERLLHVYGPTESTTFTTWQRVREVAAGARTVPIGAALSNTELYVLDRSLEPVPVGVPGELLIGGDGLARGYLNRPGLTAAQFVPNPFGTVRGGRLYRSGDLVRSLPEGTIEFVGRIDHQVKIRGFRIELGEIEAVLARHPGVREAVVMVREHDGEGASHRRLVAYVVRAGAAALDAVALDAVALDVGELRSYLGDSLPAYMVPPAVVFLDALPWTPAGKVDRKALPAPEPGTGERAASWVPPRSPIEEMVAGIWTEVLGQVAPVSQVGVYDDFFELGGHSLLATQVSSRVSRVLGIDIGPRLLFENPTVAAMAAELEQRSAADRGAPTAPLVAVEREGPIPLSFSQERLWFIQQLEPEYTAYNHCMPLRLAGALDREAMRRAFEEIGRRHEVLRTTVALVGEGPVQVIAPPGEHPMPGVDLTALTAADRELEAGRLVGSERGRIFDLVRGPLFRTTLLQLAEDDHVVLIRTHHIVFDGWSIAIVVRELAALYRTFLAGGDPRSGSLSLPALPLQYADFACWQRRWLSEEQERQLDYWRRHLGSPQSAARLAPDRSRREGEASWAERRLLHLSEATSNALRSLTRQQGATLFMTLTAAFQTLLHRHTGADAVIVGTPIANRHRYEIEPLIGFFVNTLALRSDFADDPPFRELLTRG
ncbi:MAG: amino acid adenylation domain-containing protein, partial [bacterium]|nr:amino acid adenylation domain-containing protein [bacterium]